MVPESWPLSGGRATQGLRKLASTEDVSPTGTTWAAEPSCSWPGWPVCLQRTIAWSAWLPGTRACAEMMTFGQQTALGSIPSETAQSLTRHELVREAVPFAGAKVSVQMPSATVPWSAS